MDKVTILGAGLAGLGAMHRLSEEGLEAIIFEKNAYYGGHAATFIRDGFIFDDGPHISFTDDERLRNLFHQSVNYQVEAFTPRMNNYWQGYKIKHPAQVNLCGLPTALVTKIIQEFFDQSIAPQTSCANYRDWLYQQYGKTFSNTFPIAYAKKYHTLDADAMDIDWIGPRMYKPSMEEVLKGALAKETKDVYYVKHFYYPSDGGFAAFLSGLVPTNKVKYQHEVRKLEPKSRLLTFAGGNQVSYEEIISSIPLPELIAIIDPVPAEIVAASQKLACSQCVTINLGIAREDLSDMHWSYFYDEDIIFSRVSYPHLFSPQNVPNGYSSIQVEVYFSKKYKPMPTNPEQLVPRVIKDLQKCKILQSDDKIVFQDHRVIPYANVIFDLDRQSNLKLIHDYLHAIGIRYCGRFGDWGYHWTDDAFLSGERAAQQVLDSVVSQ